MLAIRLQRIGRKGYPVYRIAVQEAQRHPSSGRVVAYVGSYNPHTKQVNIDKEKIESYLKNGAQPSPRVVKLLDGEKVKLPDWVKRANKKEKAIRTPEKLRRNQPKKEESAPTPTAEKEAPVEPEGSEAVTEPAVDPGTTETTPATDEPPKE